MRTKIAIGRAIEHIKSNWANGESLKEICVNFELDPGNLDRAFRNAMGIPMKQYVNRKRRQKVLRLIVHSKLEGYKIAEKIGMSDLAFYKWVKREFGESLSEIRRRTI